MWGVAAPEPGKHGVSLAQVFAAHSTDNCMVLGNTCRGSTVSARAFVQGLLGSSAVPSGIAAKDQGRQQ